MGNNESEHAERAWFFQRVWRSTPSVGAFLRVLCAVFAVVLGGLALADATNARTLSIATWLGLTAIAVGAAVLGLVVSFACALWLCSSAKCGVSPAEAVAKTTGGGGSQSRRGSRSIRVPVEQAQYAASLAMAPTDLAQCGPTIDHHVQTGKFFLAWGLPSLWALVIAVVLYGKATSVTGTSDFGADTGYLDLLKMAFLFTTCVASWSAVTAFWDLFWGGWRAKLAQDA